MPESSESTLQRTFSVMEYLSRERRSVPLQELAQALSLSEIAAHRILKGLIDLGYAQQDQNGCYQLTYKIYRVAGKALNREGFMDTMIPYMNYFAQRCGCEVGLSVREGNEMLQIQNVGKPVSLGRALLRPGQRFPLHCTAGGKVILSQMEPQELEAWLAENTLLPMTDRSIIDPQQLREEIRLTRERGYGVSEGELFDIVYAVSFPIHDPDGTVQGIFNFRMGPERYQESMCSVFVEDVKKALQNFGL